MQILRGIAIRESELLEGNEVECYRYIPESELPSEPRSRLEALFAIKVFEFSLSYLLKLTALTFSIVDCCDAQHKWGLDELQPYLEPLCNAQTKVCHLHESAHLQTF